MNHLQITLDICMVVLWFITYVMVLISTIKFKQPYLAPLFQLFALPFEIATLFHFISKGQAFSSYAFYAYLLWALTNGTTLIIVLKNYFKPKPLIIYGIGFIIVLITMFILVTSMDYVFLFSYVNTFVGMVLWFIYIFKKEYPINSFSLVIFILKFIADAIAIVVYFNYDSVLTNIICVALPILDFAFIVVWIIRKIQSKSKKDEATQIE